MEIFSIAKSRLINKRETSLKNQLKRFALIETWLISERLITYEDIPGVAEIMF